METKIGVTITETEKQVTLMNNFIKSETERELLRIIDYEIGEKIILPYLRDITPYDTGDLRRSMMCDSRYKEGIIYLRFGTMKEYARFVEEGTGIYNPAGRKTPWVYKLDRGTSRHWNEILERQADAKFKNKKGKSKWKAMIRARGFLYIWTRGQKPKKMLEKTRDFVYSRSSSLIKIIYNALTNIWEGK